MPCSTCTGLRTRLTTDTSIGPILCGTPSLFVTRARHATRPSPLRALLRARDDVAWRVLHDLVHVDAVVLFADLPILDHLAHDGRGLDQLASRLVNEFPVDVEHHVVIREGAEGVRLKLLDLNVVAHRVHHRLE